MDNLIAALIFIFGSIGLFLVLLKNKWGPIVGLIGQLLFSLAAYFDKTRGLFIYSLILTLIWIYGIYLWRIKKK